ncbi:hypothetical protein TSMEX_001196, partial [Taenia solium]
VVVAEQMAKSTLTAEALVIAPSEKHAEDMPTGSGSISDPQGNKRSLCSRRVSADAVDAVEDDVTMEIGAASPAGKQNGEQRESDGDPTIPHEADASRVEENVAIALSQTEVEDLVVVEQAANSTPTAEYVAIVPNATQAEDGSVGSRSASNSQSNKRSLRSRRMLVNSVDTVGENATMEISVASPVDSQNGVQSEGEVKGVDTITHEGESLREAEGVTAAPSQTAAEEVSTASRSSSDSRGDKRSWHSHRVLLDPVDAAEDIASMDTSVASLGGKRNDEPREGEGDGVGTHEAELSRVVENVAHASSQTEAKDVVVVDQTAGSAPALEAMASVSSEMQAKDVSLLPEKSSNQANIGDPPVGSRISSNSRV